MRFILSRTGSDDRLRSHRGRGSYQNHHRVVQGPVGVQRLHLLLDDVVPLHAQVDEAPGPRLLSPAVEDVVARRLVLDRCKEPPGKS